MGLAALLEERLAEEPFLEELFKKALGVEDRAGILAAVEADPARAADLLCETAKEGYGRVSKRLERYETYREVLILACVLLALAAVVLILAQYLTYALASSAVNLISLAMTAVVEKGIRDLRPERDRYLAAMEKYCATRRALRALEEAEGVRAMEEGRVRELQVALLLA